MSENKCSLKIVNDKTGNRLAGTAAMLHVTSKAGGFDQFMQDFAEGVAKEAVSKLLAQQRQPNLKVVD